MCCVLLDKTTCDYFCLFAAPRNLGKHQRQLSFFQFNTLSSLISNKSICLDLHPPTPRLTKQHNTLFFCISIQHTIYLSIYYPFHVYFLFFVFVHNITLYCLQSTSHLTCFSFLLLVVVTELVGLDGEFYDQGFVIFYLLIAYWNLKCAFCLDLDSIELAL